MRLGRWIACALTAVLVLVTGASGDETAKAPDTGIYGFSLPRIDGTPESLGRYRGQVLLLVNVASRCGLTPQYEGLEALYDRYRDQGFAVLGFPANDFASQEPGTDAEIADFCRSTYGVRFPMFSKIHVRGEEIHPLYRYLTSRPAPIGGDVRWNFQKYLVDRQGRVVMRFDPRVEPLHADLVGRVETLLEAQG
jgi:glutathione peroxidase